MVLSPPGTPFDLKKTRFKKVTLSNLNCLFASKKKL